VVARRTPANLYGALFGSSRFDWKRERWDTPDGDFIDVDLWQARPILARCAVSRLEGSSNSHYASALARELTHRVARRSAALSRVLR